MASAVPGRLILDPGTFGIFFPIFPAEHLTRIGKTQTLLDKVVSQDAVLLSARSVKQLFEIRLIIGVV